MKNLSFNKGRPSCLCIFIIVILLSNQMYAAKLTFGSYTKQLQHQITGTVTDVAGPLPSVTVIVKGTTTSAVTDEKGNFSITASSTDILVFSFIGYSTQEIIVGRQTSIKVRLSEDSTQLQEVTINAGYYSVKEKERTGSISRITSKDIETQPVTNMLATMQGRMAGVSITQNSGVPGGGFDIQIRGQNSLRSDANRPLFIIDGVPYASETTGFYLTAGAQPTTTSPLNSINPSDIESIEVLKDADATAIYGSRGANGVVLITTKKGKAGKTTFNVTTMNGTGRVTRFMDLMNTEQYLAMRNEAFVNDGIQPGPSDYDVNGTWDSNKYTDWQKELTGGTVQINDVKSSISGGSAKTQFLISGDFHKETSVFPGEFRYKKGGIHVNLNHTSDDEKFRAQFSGGYTVQDNLQPGTDLSAVSKRLAPNAPSLYTPDGNLNWENSTWENPLSLLESKTKGRTGDLLANVLFSYQILPELTVKSSFGFTDLRHEESRTMPSSMYDPAYEAGSEFSILYLNTTSRRSWIVEPQVEWSKSWNKSKTSVLAGATFQQLNGRQLVQEGDGFASNALIYNLASAYVVDIRNDSEQDYRYQAFFGRANYNYDDRYIVNLTGRRDGSSRFGPGKQFAYFGAVGAAWLFTNEKLFKEHSTFLSFGKLRASYGTSGSDQIGDYQFMDTYTSSGSNYNGISGLHPTRLFNPDFGWESNTKVEFALETGFLKDRIYLTTGWYSNRSSNQLVGIPLPGTTGFSSIQANLDATVENQGIELTLRTVNFHSEEFDWTTSFNISASRNKLLSFPDLEGSTYQNQYVIGRALNIRKVYHYTGLDPASGLYTFEDVNGDGSLSAPEDKQTILDLNPKYFGGLQNQITYRGVQLNFLFQFVKQDNYNATYLGGMPGIMSNQPTTVINHWQHPGDTSGYQLYSSGVNGAAVEAFSKYYDSDATITDASYIRLKNISLSYTIPKKWLSGLNCRVFVEGQNLLTITHYNGADPEFRSSGFLPPLKIFTAGLQFTL
ncbi:TonB-linked SusC/RagA family outer membrane protein [Flavobacterium araucananum]|uniref:SusC/RagA family TonB-linked outer membrane protein n=1 Tax=Flavobacterium araucananum TaxID=946678 RepID=UPI000D6C2FCF|nr:SusC/RagA family TonB-linked outer membrane protein [Flavobacterium araucananum]PWJ97104.1 TonB-linked SusC/RagA family outer membrane protein [Flavobacterium araucananum]